MRMNSSRLLALTFCACPLLLPGQDAELLLRTTVTYTTQRDTRQLAAEQRKDADALLQRAREAGDAKKYGEALRLLHHGFAVIEGAPWTPALETASSLHATVDHAMVEPGRTIAISLAPYYSAEHPVTEDLKASIVLRPAATSAIAPTTLASMQPVDSAHLPVSVRVAIPDIAAGDYVLEARLTDAVGTYDKRAANAFLKAVPVHVEALSADADRLRARLARMADRESPAIATAGWPIALYDRADAGTANPQRYDFRKEFAGAHAILDAVEAGRDPFADKHGDFHKAYRSAVDQQLQPYRLFVPDQYEGDKPSPLIVALHGMGGDENTLFDSYGPGALKREAARLGFLVVCPKGRGVASMYAGTAEKDVMDVLAEIRRDFKIDPKRIYLMGHSMGAYGTWSIAMHYPDLFAALGPIAGGGNSSGMVKIKSIPQYVVHGDNDRTVNVSQSRLMVEAGKKVGAPIEYVEVSGGGHVDVAVPQFGPMLDFFARLRKE
jgi:predicted esterase